MEENHAIRGEKKLVPKFVGPFCIMQRISKLGCTLYLSPNLSNIHPVFQVSILMIYEPDTSHVVDNSDLVVD